MRIRRLLQAPLRPITTDITRRFVAVERRLDAAIACSPPDPRRFEEILGCLDGVLARLDDVERRLHEHGADAGPGDMSS